MAEIARVTVKAPRLRIRLCILACYILNPFVRSEETGAKIGDAMFAWCKRGLRVYVDGRRIA